MLRQAHRRGGGADGWWAALDARPLQARAPEKELASIVQTVAEWLAAHPAPAAGAAGGASEDAAVFVAGVHERLAKLSAAMAKAAHSGGDDESGAAAVDSTDVRASLIPGPHKAAAAHPAHPSPHPHPNPNPPHPHPPHTPPCSLCVVSSRCTATVGVVDRERRLGRSGGHADGEEGRDVGAQQRAAAADAGTEEAGPAAQGGAGDAGRGQPGGQADHRDAGG